MLTRIRKPLCALTAALLLIAALPITSLAADWAPQEVSGTYHYTTNEGDINQQGTDTFTYRDKCFMRSSFTGCSHLMTLSAQVAIASASRWGDGVDPTMADDPSANAQNVTQMLRDMGFSDVETNKYYTLEKQVNSAGVAVGRREIQADGKTYTLLAVIPRSANYKQEWAGNFTVGEGAYHDGFKQGRDEILRFVKQYLTAHNVTGDLKVWIAGHSRGAALSNSLGGFFAGGGAAYFDNVSVTPDNVYCYTFATPRTVKETLSKKDYLSVSGPRTEPEYANDTQTAGFTYPEDGTLDPHAEVFGGIRNYPLPYDFITMLPPAAWGYTYFGSVESYDLNGKITVEEMLEQLNVFAAFAYDEFVGGGDFRDFAIKTLDLAELEIVDDPEASKDATMAQFLSERINGLTHMAGSGAEYVSGGYQETLTAVAGLYGMLHSFKGVDLDSATDLAIEPLILAYIAYGRDALKAEGQLAQDVTDEEAACAVLCNLVTCVTGAEITGTTTTDAALVAVLTYLTAHEGSPLYNKAVGAVAELLPTEGFAAQMMVTILKMFVKDPDTATTDEMLGAMLKACVDGPEEGTQAYDNGATPETVRALVYTALGMVSTDLGNAVNYGYGPTSALVNYALGMLTAKEKDEDGNPTAYYASLDEAADGKLAAALSGLLQPLLEQHLGKYGEQFDAQLQGHVATLMANGNITKLRQMVTCMLLYTEGEPFGAQAAMRNAATFIGCVDMIPLAHYNEVNVAWCKAIDAKMSVDAPTATRTTEDGSAQQLIVPAAAKEGARMLYAIGSDSATLPDESAFSETLPTAVESGTYYVWYKMVSDYGESEADFVEVTVLEPEQAEEPAQNDPEPPAQNDPEPPADVAPRTGDNATALPFLGLAVSAAALLLTLPRKRKSV